MMSRTLTFYFLFLLYASGFSQGSSMCLAFNGTQFINIDNLLNGFSFSELTVTTWVKPTSSNSHGGVIFAFNEDNGGWDNNVNLFYFKEDHFEYFDKNPSNFNIPTPSLFPIGHWYHVALVIDQNLNGKIYINGVERLSFDAFEVPSAGDRFSIGQEWDGYNESGYFQGEIDEMRIWNEALSQQKIREDMCQSIQVNSPYLIAYYKFDAGFALGFPDSTPNGNTGTLVGFSTTPYILSGAPIGTQSIGLYTNNWNSVLSSLVVAPDEYLNIYNIKNNPSGIHIYWVDSPPNSSNGISIQGAQAYFGVFATDHNTRYDMEYGFGGITDHCIDCEKSAILYSRNDNTELLWHDLDAMMDLNDCKGTRVNESNFGQSYREEYILGFESNQLSA